MHIEHHPAIILEYMAGGSLAAYLCKHRGQATEPAADTGRLVFTPWEPTSSLDDAPQPSSFDSALPPEHAPVKVTQTRAAASTRTGAPSNVDARTEKVLGFCVQLASGLAFLHANGKLSPTLKPTPCTYRPHASSSLATVPNQVLAFPISPRALDLSAHLCSEA
jgi:serine/threonine protein kinase